MELTERKPGTRPRGLLGKPVVMLVRDTFASWNGDYAQSMGAAIAFYAMTSIAPLLLIVIAVAGLVFGHDMAQEQIIDQLRGLMGEEGATAIKAMLDSADKPVTSSLATVFSLAVLLFSATTVFAELQNAFDRIWQAPARVPTSGIWSFVRTRLLSFGMMLAIAFLLMVSLVVSAAIAALGNWWGSWFDSREALLQAINFLASFALITVLFALMYKFMPRVHVKWHDVWLGAAVTAALFVLGKLLIGIYLGKSGVASGFGAAASLVILLLWIYYSAQIFLFGAEFTWVYANRHGSLRVAHKKQVGENGKPPDQAAMHSTPEGRRAV